MFTVEHLNNRRVGFVIIWKGCCALFGSRKLNETSKFVIIIILRGFYYCVVYLVVSFIGCSIYCIMKSHRSFLCNISCNHS